MNNNLKVLKLFVDNKDKTFTIKKAAETLKINYKIVYEEIIKLEKEELIKITKQGNAKVCISITNITARLLKLKKFASRNYLKIKTSN